MYLTAKKEKKVLKPSKSLYDFDDADSLKKYIFDTYEPSNRLDSDNWSYDTYFKY